MFQKMWKKVLNYIIGILFILSLIMNGILGCQNYRYRNTLPEKIEIHDSIFVPKDSIITKVKWKDRWDTITEIQYKDTVIHDTVRIPIEHKVSEFSIEKDSLKITEKIHHSGWHSSIDSVELDYSFNYELKPAKKKKFGWCITVGPSINYSITLDTRNKTWSNGPSVGVSVVVGPSYIIK